MLETHSFPDILIYFSWCSLSMSYRLDSNEVMDFLANSYLSLFEPMVSIISLKIGFKKGCNIEAT